MKVKNIKLEYFVFYESNDKISKFNVLEGMEELIAKNVRSKPNAYDHIHDKFTLIEFLRHYFMYRYWSKAEFEYGVCPLFDLYKNDFQRKLANKIIKRRYFSSVNLIIFDHFKKFIKVRFHK